MLNFRSITPCQYCGARTRGFLAKFEVANAFYQFRDLGFSADALLASLDPLCTDPTWAACRSSCEKLRAILAASSSLVQLEVATAPPRSSVRRWPACSPTPWSARGS